MKAFRVVVDGQSQGDLGVADFAVGSVSIAFTRRSDAELLNYHFHVGGLTRSDENGVSRHYRWAIPSIREGSRIEIEIVDSENCEPPTKFARHDHEVQESCYTEEEQRELRHQDYLELKKEFER
jgi:hypothetical protein